MTKYEWEAELQKNIHRLPRAEQEKALEYYRELFADKIEAGMTEIQIISEFGNPCDVADKILAEYEAEGGKLPPVTEAKIGSPTILTETQSVFGEAAEDEEKHGKGGWRKKHGKQTDEFEHMSEQGAQTQSGDECRESEITVGRVIGCIFDVVWIVVIWGLVCAYLGCALGFASWGTSAIVFSAIDFAGDGVTWLSMGAGAILVGIAVIMFACCRGIVLRGVRFTRRRCAAIVGKRGSAK